ncbi:MAG: [protein-PII] uridylyltransferase [Gammaproteobacteria bacterium]|nr:[protein-PII] uridylyltransferase [Gammaproteobacteria bacterium]
MSAPAPLDTHEALALLPEPGQQPPPASVGPAYKACIEHLSRALAEHFRHHRDADRVVRLRAELIGTVLARSWTEFALDESAHALVAVGGFGRGELHPGSDIDIAVILAAEPTADERHRLERWLTFLWDTGLEIGHSVRTAEECATQARDDLTIVTNLMETRLLAGNPAPLAEMQRLTAPARMWSAPEFFAAKLAEQAQRAARFGDAAGQLEPNVKDGPGGLRDVQTIAWVANRHFGGGDLEGLRRHGFLTAQEFAVLDEARRFMWQVRMALHLVAGRRVDRLLFEHQREVAGLLGYAGEGNTAIERFMRDYYRTTRELAALCEMLLGLFRQAVLEPAQAAETRTLNRRFQVCNGAIEARHPGIFRHRPQALLELFLLLQQHPEIEGVRATTIRLVRENLHLIDDDFRGDIRSRSLFLEILRQPRRLGDELSRMHRYGVLAAYLPVFAHITGRMQFDLFHAYTVDEHTLRLVRNLRRFSYPLEPDDQPRLCREALERIPKLELLYIAGLFHDIAKGRGGDHSELGAEDAVRFCSDHGFGHFDTHVVAWLVRNHLLMSATAQRKDIYDPAVIAEFARQVGDQVHLDYLYLLTVADIRATNPELWTSWKASLLGELYAATRSLLHKRPGSAPARAERLAALREEARALIAQRQLHLSSNRLERLWNGLGEDYFLRHRAEEIAWHAEHVLPAAETDLPVVAVRHVAERGCLAIFVYARDAARWFALTTATLDALQLDIQDARVLTTADGYTLDTYTALEREGGHDAGAPARLEDLRARLRHALVHGESPAAPRAAGLRRKTRHFRVEPQVSFFRDEHRRSVMEVIAADRPGLLADVGDALAHHDVSLIDARIATFGERVEDYFYISDHAGRPFTDADGQERLRARLLETLA